MAVFDGQANVFEALTQLLGDTFWTLFDAIKIIMINAIKAIPEIITELWKVITSPIKIPIISTIWNAFVGSDTPLTILNAITIIPSWALNIYAGTVYGKMPFDAEVFGDPSRVFPTEEQVKSWLRPRSAAARRSSLGRKSKDDPLGGQANVRANTISPVSLEMLASGEPTGSPQPAVHTNSLTGWQLFDLILSILSPATGAISGLIDVYCIFTDAAEAGNVPVDTGKAQRIIGNNNEMQVFGPDYQRLADVSQAAPSFSDRLLRIFRAMVAVFVLFCCIYNFIIGIAYSDEDWTEVWQHPVRLTGIILQSARIITIFRPRWVWPGYVADMGSILQYGVGGFIPSGSASADTRALTSVAFSSLSALFTCIARAFGDDPQAAAIIFIALGFDAANGTICAIIYRMSTDTLTAAAQHPSIAAAADIVRSSSPAGLSDKNKGTGSEQYKLPSHLDSMFFKAGLF